MDPVPQPWFRGSTDSQPFSLFTVLTSNGGPFNSIACFPWTAKSLEILWNGSALQETLVPQWQDVVTEWMGAIAAGGKGRLCIFPKLGTKKPIVVKLKEADAEVENVAWAINSNEPLKPLIVFTVTSVILIYDVKRREIVGKLRGHGGPITCLAVHPTSPELFCTTSKDFTARIYDLTLSPVQVPNNPNWLPHTKGVGSLAGPAHGLHMCEPEGEGIGRAVAVMVGGRSGGHRGAVLCCAFHPSQPLIATGGIDRTVKIWRIPPSVFTVQPSATLAREDKPLFSTDLIHKARVLFLSWLDDDILISCSAPALMRRNPMEVDKTYWEDGTAMTWQWLGFNRFFPAGKIPQKVMRGTASDWRNSESFKILSGYHIPSVAKHFQVYRSFSHDPLLLIPMGKIVRIFNISQFSPRQPPKFPLDTNIASLTSKLSLDDDGSDPGTPRPRSPRGGGSSTEQDDDENESASRDNPSQQEGDQDEEEDGEDDPIPTTTYPPPAPLTALFDSVEGYDVVAELPPGNGPPEMADVTTCAMGFEGLGIAGIGERGTLYVWRLRR
ncbi:WD40 repeat-like protein [Dichomitus squalens LYAD-421 SS1]|uniref:WD40 repeat-like protein n=1 Tax=Dichomitus squalens (strain LYAD-421) TaxID=732165 RepID=UPI00044138DF|nr:WD40 repeat-like protein [Dichomitus squalens LYAD-421 SS1]EJF66780.1 WD40 repeat-like protein [Dichomitus squalens LYAD-421 SS1]